MSPLVRIAVRNVFRHRRRTLITGAAVALAVVFMTVAAGFLDFTVDGLRDSMVYGGLGHVQLLPVSLDARARVDAVVVDEAAALLRADPRVEHVAPRLEVQGLMSAGPRTLGFSGIGVDPLVERQLRAMTMLTAGEWFTGRERVPNALIGFGLAVRLQVHVGDAASLIAYSDGGRMTAAEVRIAGIFESGVIEYDARTVLMPLATARDLTETTGYSALVATVRDTADVPAVVARVHAAVAARHAAARVARWDELSPVYGSVVGLYRWILDVLMAIVTIVVVLGIANTMSMAVLERAAEVGVLRALGFGARRVVTMFLVEAGTIGALGACGGAVLGVGACAALSWLGIEMPPPPGHTQGYVAEVRIVPAAFLGAALAAITAAVVAGVVPSLRAARQEVADVLRAG